MTAYAYVSFTDIIEYQPRVEPGQVTLTAEPHLTLIPPSCREFDAERIIATYQRASVVRTFERHKLTMTAVNRLASWLDAYLSDKE